MVMLTSISLLVLLLPNVPPSALTGQVGMEGESSTGHVCKTQRDGEIKRQPAQDPLVVGRGRHAQAGPGTQAGGIGDRRHKVTDDA